MSRLARAARLLWREWRDGWLWLWGARGAYRALRSAWERAGREG